MLASAEPQAVTTADKLEQLESHMLELPQAECPVVHHFGPGIYIREVTLPANTIAIGHAQRFEHLNIMLTGSVAIIGDDGQTKILKAPMIFVGQPGRKIGYVLETCIWQNVYATYERDVDVLESTYLDKSPTWQAHYAARQLLLIGKHSDDREDFDMLVKESGFSHDLIRVQSENPDDQISMPHGHGSKVTIRPSPIEGLGVFLSSPVDEGELIAPARIFGLRTPVGRYTNHSKTPNAHFVKSNDGDVFLVSLKRIAGCSGGDSGEEVTIDYRQALTLSGIYLKGEPI